MRGEPLGEVDADYLSVNLAARDVRIAGNNGADGIDGNAGSAAEFLTPIYL
jgi:hypothetical protein